LRHGDEDPTTGHGQDLLRPRRSREGQPVRI
jgi:hypothetical protein